MWVLAVQVQAAEPLVHADADLEAASLRADATPVPWSQVVSRAPGLVEADVDARPCAGPGDFAVHRDRGEGALRHGRYDEALEHLGLAQGASACLTEVASLAEVARLMGLASALAGDTSNAMAHFARARDMDDRLAWSELDPEQVRGLFDGATPARSVHLAVVAPDASEVRVDGRPAGTGIDVEPGTHLVQLRTDGWHGLVVELPKSSHATLVLPDAFRPDAIGWAADPDHRAELSALLARSVGYGRTFFLADSTTLWYGTTGRVDWSPVEQRAPSPEPISAATASKKRIGWITLSVGGAAMLGGATLYGTGFPVASTIRADHQVAETEAEATELSARYDSVRARMDAGRWTLVAGAVVASTGVVLAWRLP